ncbi:MAG: D-alpha,beta-D-heptose 1,7-bisphosphate phosphatase [Candidatus Solibacter sp.]|nr:D-alpha,beta-D-heptose 1,7-bisphosphate phosphatase [Candidatus Solibacter sp.]
MSTEAVFLDRDGVLNLPVVREGRPYPPAMLAQLEIYPDAAAALTRLKQAGYLLIVVTNQPDVARGTQSPEAVDAINAAIGARLPIDEFLVCGHDDPDDCDCRKPKAGLVLRAAAAYGIDLRRSFLIGDRWRDIDCGASAGVRTVLIDRQYRERAPANPPDHVTNSLTGAADWILSVKDSTSA